MKRDVMEALAAARPEQLDPPADPDAARDRRERDLARAFLADPEAPRSAGRARGRRPVRWALLGAVAAGAAAAVGIATAGSPGSPGSPARPGPPGSIDLNRQAVLAAATKAEQAPTGKYWFADTVDGQSYIIRAKTGTYAISAASSETFQWTGAKKGMGEAVYGRDLPAHPVTPRDEALWRKAGSPSSFRVWSSDHYFTYKAKGTGWRSDGPEVGVDPHGGGGFVGAKRGLSTLDDLRKLPTDPDRLAAIFLSEKAMDPAMGRAPGHRPRSSPERMAGAKFWRVSAILSGPAPSRVRAGLIRALTAQPGVHAIGHATDPLGRRGVALATDDQAATVTGEYGTPKAERGTYRSRTVIMFDERTGALLSVQDQLTAPGGRYAEMKPGFVINYSAERAAGWTDTKPKPPAKLPF
ncbi:CU044_5270 family protein [Actinomadura verrucosospora]|uniref:CU044_5270 family protein n=1 Tax=Actinomadura verrucosospora TaxID=46165 RepID=A0A7D4APD4_ACTVE|nr:CU044_5270 family protein [Actinomadura verrucosospora]QKG23308.1 hypothetical protein ACTIVE_4951 [Actinomadura verrucosospora]